MFGLGAMEVLVLLVLLGLVVLVTVFIFARRA